MSLKKCAFRKLVDLNNPNIVLLQETLDEGDIVSKLLEYMLSGWTFIGLNVRDHKGI